MLIFIKLGGSLITDKRESEHYQAEIMRRVASEIAHAAAARPDLSLLIGHGSGSFGHVAAKKHGTIDGVHSLEQWRGFAEVATVARKLNSLVLEALTDAGLPVISVQPSASAHCEDGKLLHLDLAPITTALANNLIPLVYGDVALDAVRGGTIISTETIFSYLTDQLQPARIMLLGETEGVYDSSGVIIPRITPATLGAVEAALGGSDGADVTGGMAAKVRAMLDLAERVPGLEIRIFGGTMPGQIESALCGDSAPGTLITAVEEIAPNGTARQGRLRISNITQELSALQTVTEVMATDIDLDDLLRLIIDKLVETVDSERGTLYLIDPARGELYSKVLQEDSGTLSEIRIKIGQGLAGNVAATGQVLNIRQAYNDPRFDRSFDQATGFRTRTVLTAPMRNPRGQIIGVVQVLNKIGGPFMERDERMLVAMAAQAAISIENARLLAQEMQQQLIAQELRTARTIQRNFLPQTIPQDPRWDIYAFWSPAQDVAGDFYDVRPMTDGRWAIVVGDVSGKGIPASLFMALSVTVLRYAVTLDFGAGELLRNINRSLCSFNHDSQMFATIFIAYLDLNSGEIECANAGHNPPLLHSADGSQSFIKIPGILAGMFEEIVFSSHRQKMSVGDVVVFYTDGITEAINKRDEEFGEERLKAILAANAQRSAPEIVRALIDAVEAHAGERGAFDDQTLIVLKRKSA